MAQYTYVYVNHTHLYNWSPAPYYSCFKWLLQWSNNLYSATYSYWASFHDAYGWLHHTHWWHWLQLPYKSHTTYVTNHMRSISCHIMPLVINSLRGGHTHIHTHTLTHTHTHTNTHTHTPMILDKAIIRNQARTGCNITHKNKTIEAKFTLTY